jgi:hypothetical protein
MAGGNVVVVENKAAWDKHHDQSKEQKKTVRSTPTTFPPGEYGKSEGCKSSIALRCRRLRCHKWQYFAEAMQEGGITLGLQSCSLAVARLAFCASSADGSSDRKGKDCFILVDRPRWIDD